MFCRLGSTFLKSTFWWGFNRSKIGESQRRFCTRIFKLKNLSWWGSETNLVPVVELRQSASISIRYLTTTTISNPTSNTNTTVPQRPKRLRKSKSPTLATDVVEGDRPPPEVLEKRKKDLEEVRELLRNILADEPDKEKYVMYLTKRGGRTWPVRSVLELETLVMFEVQSWRYTKIPSHIKQKILQYFVQKGLERRREAAKARVAAGGKFMPV